MPGNFKKMVRARMEKTGESYQTAARTVRANGAPAASAAATSSPSTPFTRFVAQGFQGLDPLEVDGPSMLKVLRGPTDVRKSILLGALGLFQFLLARGETEMGPPLQMAREFPISPEQIRAHGRAPVVLTADVVVSPADFKLAGRAPAALSLDRMGVTLSLSWDHPLALYTIRRFEVATGRDFAQGQRNIPEIQDLHLGVEILVHMVDTLLRSARTSQSTAAFKSTLDEREQRVIDIVSGYSLSEGAGTPMTQVLLSVPRGAAERKTAEEAADKLVKNGYLVRDDVVLYLTVPGLMACAQAGEVAAFAERLLDYITFRAEEERGRFNHYTLQDLQAANVVGPGEYAFARVVIALLRLGAGNGPVWSTPPDIVELRGIEDIRGLLDRCEQLRKQDEARAAAEREALARQAAEAARQAAMAPSVRERSDETWHRLRDWTQGQTRSEQLAALILLSQGFADLEPSHPRGGPDGGKDAICTKDGMRWIMAVYFPTKPQKFSVIRKKFLDDLRGVQANDAAGIAFVTNQELTLERREELKKAAGGALVAVFHLDTIATILNGPSPEVARWRKLYLDLE